jgi:manganese transport protein
LFPEGKNCVGQSGKEGSVLAYIASANQKTVSAAHLVMANKQKGLRAFMPFVGPAFIAAVAYIDPGNYATNIQGGSEFGYNLLWVIVVANIMAMFVQNLSAKLGIASGRNLPELCRIHFPAWISMLLWIFSEIAAMATDLAEFLGATLAFNLLLHIPMIVGTLMTAVITYAMLTLDRFGFRPLEKVIGCLVVAIGVCYLAETVFSRPNWGQIAYHSVVPWIGGKESILLIVGIIGATIMPHVVYLHSGLTNQRIVPKNDMEKRKISHFSTLEIIVAMGLAGLINLAMMYMSASAFYSTGHTSIGDISTAYRTLPILGSAAAAVFLVSLLVSGLSSSAVGTMAGQVIMNGFVGFTIPVWLRRVITMVPTVIIVAIGVNPTQTLIISQVILSIVLPLPIFCLIYFTRRKDIMGIMVNKPWMTFAAYAIACLVFILNITLIILTLV